MINSYDPPPFILLDRHILLSICANSASCEMLFSIFGTTLTKLQNRLGTNTLDALSELKMHICDDNLWEKKVNISNKHLPPKIQA